MNIVQYPITNEPTAPAPDLFNCFVDQHLGDFKDKPDDYVDRAVAHGANGLSALAMLFCSWNEDAVVPGVDEPWECSLADHVDAEVTKGAALAFAAHFVHVAREIKRGNMRDLPDGPLPVRPEVRTLCKWVWSLANEEPTYAEGGPYHRDTGAFGPSTPRKEVLPRFWAIGPDTLTWLEREHDRADAAWAAFWAREQSAPTKETTER